MLVTSFILFAWAMICWFSAPFTSSFLNLVIFEIDPLIPFVASGVAALAALLIRVFGSGSMDLERFTGWIRGNRLTAAILVSILLLHVLFQLPLLSMRFGNNVSDNSLYGLAGYLIADGKERPMFLLGRNHQGTLVPHLVAPLNALFGKSPIYQRLATTAIYLAFLAVLFVLIRRAFDDKLALLSTALAAIPPYHFFNFLKYPECSELLLLGVLSLYLLLRMVEPDRPGWRQYFWYGAVLGISFWAYMATIYFMAAGAIILFLRDRLFLIRPQILAAPLSFCLGCSPIFIDSYYFDWRIFRDFFSQAQNPAGLFGRFWEGASIFLEYIRGMSLFRKWTAYQWASTAYAVVLLIAAVVFIVRYHRELARFLKLDGRSAGPFLILIPALVIFLIFSMAEQARTPNSWHYVIAVWAFLPVLLASLCCGLMKKSKIAGAILPAALILTVAVPNVFGLMSVATRDQRLTRLLATIEQNGTNRFYGPFHRTYLITFSSGGAVVGSTVYHNPKEWYTPLIDEVENTGSSPAFMFEERHRRLQEDFTMRLQSLGVDYIVSESELGAVAHTPSNRITPLRLNGIEEGGYSVGQLKASIADVATRSEDVAPLKLIHIIASNDGAVTWRANGINGHVEIVLSSRNGQLLRYQPLTHDTPPGAIAHWALLLDGQECDGGRALLELRVNGIRIWPRASSSEVSIADCEMDTLRSEDARPVPNLDTAEIASLDCLFFKGWHAPTGDAESKARWSSDNESTIGFVIHDKGPVEIRLLARPMKGGKMPEGKQGISFHCNGKPVGESIQLTKRQLIRLRLDADTVRRGLNKLTLQYELVERRYQNYRSMKILTPRPKGVLISSVKVSQTTLPNSG